MNPKARLAIGIACWVGPLLIGAVVATLVATWKPDGPKVGRGIREDLARRPSPIDRDRLQGPWVAVKVERDGVPIYQGEEARLARVSFVDDEVTFTDNDVIMRGTFHLDPTSIPKTFDLIILEGGRRRTYPSGIYSLEDSTFRLCFAFPDGRRPTQFATQPGSGRTLFVYQRAGMDGVVGPGRRPELSSKIEMAMRPAPGIGSR